MQKNVSDKLWAVKVRNATAMYPSTTSLWILASDVEIASRKARRWMRQNAYSGYAIASVESHGTIDAF